MKQSNYQFRKAVVVSAAILLAMIPGTMRPALCQSSSYTASPTDSQQTSDHPLILQGVVEHSDKLPPVQGFQIGSQFNQAKALASVPPTRVWYRVPPWLAGSWRTDQYTQTFDLNYKTGSQDSTANLHNAELTERWGIQRDRDGGLWDAIDMPFIGTTTSDKHVWKDLHTGDELIFDSDVRLIIKYRATRTTVDKATNTITGVQQFESFATLTLAGPDTVRDEYSLKFFDQQGNPIDFVKGWRFEHKFAPFTEVDIENGQDMRPSFKEYLISRGLENLVPPE